MQTLTKITDDELPFKWLDLTWLRNSNSSRKEIYLEDKGNPAEELKAFFYSCFGNLKEDIVITNNKWGYFSLDMWNINDDTYDFSPESLSHETNQYIKMLLDSGIDPEYDGLCICNNWENFLSIILPAIVNHIAPYSPYFLNKRNDYMFYFHHTNSIGIYYKSENKAIQDIFQKASELNCVITE